MGRERGSKASEETGHWTSMTCQGSLLWPCEDFGALPLRRPDSKGSAPSPADPWPGRGPPRPQPRASEEPVCHAEPAVDPGARGAGQGRAAGTRTELGRDPSKRGRRGTEGRNTPLLPSPASPLGAEPQARTLLDTRHPRHQERKKTIFNLTPNQFCNF